MNPTFRIEIIGSDMVLNNLEKWGKEAIQKLNTESELIAVDIESWMKGNAPWTDRTGNARRGLFGMVVKGWQQLHIVFGHSPDIFYGASLELNNSGRYAIVRPAFNKFREIFKTLAGY